MRYWNLISLMTLLILSEIGFISQSTAVAQDDSGIAWRGFLTSGVVASDSDQTYDTGINQTPNFLSLSRFGLNLSSRVSPTIDVAAQIVAQNNKLTPDWAFASWYPLNGLAFRFGKQKFPVWFMSDRLDVGKTYPWIEPPSEVYRQNPIDAIAGIGAGYNLNLGPFELLGEFVVGGFNTELESAQEVNGKNLTVQIEGNDVVAGNLVLGNDFLKVRIGGATARVKVQTELYKVERLTGSFWSYGLQLNYNGLLLLSEYAVISTKIDKKDKKKVNRDAAEAVFKAGSSDDEVVKLQAQKAVLNALIHNGTLMGGKSYYITSGYQIGNTLPHVTYARILTPDDSVSYGDQYSVTTGLKYDINTATDLKLEWQRVTPERHSWGLFERSQTGLKRKYDPINIYKAALNFVF